MKRSTRSEADYDAEIMLIAAQSDESPRRVRAQLEKSGNMDVLRNQIIERKVIDLILENAKFKEVPFAFERTAGRSRRSSLAAANKTTISPKPSTTRTNRISPASAKKDHTRTGVRL